MQTGGLDGRVVVITGGSSGIGLATGTACAAEGARVVLLARRPDRLAAAAERVGNNATAVPCDVADPDSVRAAFSAIGERFGHVDALLNVAGVARLTRIEEATDDDLRHVMGVNLFGPIHTTRAAIPWLRAAGGGDIVNVSSEITIDHLPRMVLYATSKAGLEAFSRQCAHELRADAIRVSMLMAGSTSGTEFANNFDPAALGAAFPEWEASGYLTRVAGPPMDPAWTASAFVFVLTRPRGQTIDVLHVRSFAPGHGT